VIHSDQPSCVELPTPELVSEMPSIVDVLQCIVACSHWAIAQHREGERNRDRGEEQKVNEIRFDRIHGLVAIFGASADQSEGDNT